jgi:hypothetical protein
MIVTCGLFLTIGTPQEEADFWADAMEDALTAGFMNTGYVYTGAKLRTPAGGIYEAPRTVAGAGGGNPLPNNCTMLVRKITARGGRQGRGRMYLPMIFGSENQVSPTGAVEPVLVGAYQAIADNAFPGANWRLLHDSESAGSTVPDQITAFVAQGRIATQRRRMRR